MEPSCDIVTRCGHVFHRGCIETALRQLGRSGQGQLGSQRGVFPLLLAEWAPGRFPLEQIRVGKYGLMRRCDLALLLPMCECN